MGNGNWQKEIKRTLDYAGTAGVLIQPEVDKIVTEIIEYKNPLRQNIPRKQRSTDSWLLNRRTSAGNTAGQWVADTTEPDLGNTTTERITFQFRTLLARGKVTRFAVDAGRSYIDVLSEEIEARARAFRDEEERAMLYGNTGDLEMEGLRTLIPSGQRIANVTTPGGAAIVLKKVDETLDACAGNPDIIIMSKSGKRELNSKLQGSQRFVDSIEVKGGFRVMSYDDVPIFASTNVRNTFWFDGTQQVLGTTGDTSTMFVLDTQEYWIGMMNDVTVTPLSQTSSQFSQFDIFSDTVGVMASTIHHAQLVGFDS